MNTMRSILLLILCVVTFSSLAQNKKKEAKSKEGSALPNSLSPNTPDTRYAERKASKSKKSNGPTYNLEQAYYERMEDVAKNRRKSERQMLKPQYSDPMYFGHKRPPKKHSRKKMRFCKECGIRH